MNSKDVDKIVGQNLRSIRKANNWSQTKLGNVVGITYQQCSKQEAGTNRISAGTLFMYAQALDVPIEQFYHGAIPAGPVDKLSLVRDARINLTVVEALLKEEA